MTGSDLPRGAVMPPRPITSEDFDRAHGQTAKNDLLWQISSAAFGEDCPTEIQAWGTTTWWTLGRFVSGLRLAPGQVLLDLACGRGGVGLWLARALHAELVGVDWSPKGVHEATVMASRFVPEGKARFVVGDLAGTGLPSESVDGAICADAVFFAPDRIAVFTEVARVLRPGARFVFTADESNATDRPAAVPDWAPIIEHGGLTVVAREEIPGWRDHLSAMYDAWLSNIDTLRAELGEESADDLVEEANNVGPTLIDRTGVLYTTEKPGAEHHG
jgi:ubiquinone/menaquinone biosynthesis C-methylase UbiE